jgi:hypothetical protein
MRIGAGAAVIIALSVCGCGFLHSSNLAPTLTTTTTTSGAPDDPRGFDASPTDENDSPPPTERQPPSDEPTDSGSIQFLSPKWAKEEAPQKEEWEKRLDQIVNNVCRGC